MDPEFAHVEVVHSSNQGNQSANIHGRFPMITHCSRFHQEEHCRSHHCDGDNPEGNRDRIIGIEEPFQVYHCRSCSLHCWSCWSCSHCCWSCWSYSHCHWSCSHCRHCSRVLR